MTELYFVRNGNRATAAIPTFATFVAFIGSRRGRRLIISIERPKVGVLFMNVVEVKSSCPSPSIKTDTPPCNAPPDCPLPLP